jgi:hypothetical protein
MRVVRLSSLLPNYFSTKAAVFRLPWCPLCLLLLAVFGANSAQAQSQSQTSAQPSVESKSKSQTDTSAQSQSNPKADSLADAARKAKAKKGASATGKVFTEDDLSSLPGNSVSVVGQKAAGAGSSKASNVDADDAAGSGNGEAYWRGRASELLQQIAAVDQQIAQVQEEIKKYGNGGFDPATGLSRNVIYVEDRQTKLKRLDKRKEDLQQQMQTLEEQGRKAGAPPGWFR